MTFPSLAIQLGITTRTRSPEVVLDVLRALHAEGVKEVSAGSLAQAVGFAEITVYRALAQLEAEGQVSRQRCGWRGTYVYEVHADE